ncbi:MAG: MBL fold metallo-hydrolase [Xanthomonadales bacterium]|nr:MBL fold metallo-hydrolase [Xanthomonadales bacterium]
MALACLVAFCAPLIAEDDLRVERLTWAGIKIVAGDTTVLVDAVGTDLWGGNAPGGLVPVTSDTRRTYALVTHAHNDHFDFETLRAVLGERGYVICHAAIATYIASRGLRVIPVDSWVPVSRGGFTFTAVPASDGFGDEQVSWVMAVSGKKFLHGGDTLWHGKLEMVGAQHGPFDAVFLPINGPRVGGAPASETPRVMTPAQAVDAAVLLKASLLVPIHYGLNDPPNYVEVDDPEAVLRSEAGRRGMALRVMTPGDLLPLD